MIQQVKIKSLTTIFSYLNTYRLNHKNLKMALQSIINDPNISTFLEQIPQNQHIVTLKELIYIGIKIVSNSFNGNQIAQGKKLERVMHSDAQNKENKKGISNIGKQHRNREVQNFHKKSNQFKGLTKSRSQNFQNFSNKNDKIQSTLLRQISKIRVQLQSLTNKVYDHYFEQGENQSNQSMDLNAQKQLGYVQQYGFNYGHDVPTFSPSKCKPIQVYETNPFLKQKNNFFVTQGHNANQTQRNKSLQNKNLSLYPQQRNRARSNVMHLDDTQVRQALYKENQQIGTSQSGEKHRFKKSHSTIEQRHQQKKKDQQNYFYQLSIAKQNIKQFKKFKAAESNLDASIYRDFVDDKPVKVDPYKKKAKSKIKKLVQRDRLKHQAKIQQQNYQKGLEQYEQSANQFDYDEQQSSQNQEQANFQNNYIQAKLTDHKKKQKQSLNQNKKRSSVKYKNSPQIQYSKQRQVANPNFGFYQSHEQKYQSQRKRYSIKGQIYQSKQKKYQSQQQQSPQNPQQNTFNNNNQQSLQQNEVKVDSYQSSFSQFSQFSMDGSNSSKRQVGKISRRIHH